MDYDFIISLLDVALRAFVSILFLFIITRIMGKKQISQLTYFDYIIGISIGSVASEMAATDKVPYLHALCAMLVYALVAVVISVVTNKSIWARRFFTGRTFLLIDNGKILEKNLAKVKYDINDLLSEARNAGYFNVADIAYALLETNGKISFMPTSQKTPPTLEDLNIQKPQDTLIANVIIDGVIMENNLKATGLNDSWLKKELDAQHIHHAQEVMLATVDKDNCLSVYLKTNRLVKTTPID